MATLGCSDSCLDGFIVTERKKSQQKNYTSIRGLERAFGIYLGGGVRRSLFARSLKSVSPPLSACQNVWHLLLLLHSWSLSE
jgi:hypothetical protein